MNKAAEEVRGMVKEHKQEVFRAGSASFERDFAGFVISRHRDHWRVKNCTFFHDGNRMKSWGSCTFER
jgi:hypothetical protein